jgi:hypothetical protein
MVYTELLIFSPDMHRSGANHLQRRYHLRHARSSPFRPLHILIAFPPNSRLLPQATLVSHRRDSLRFDLQHVAMQGDVLLVQEGQRESGRV